MGLFHRVAVFFVFLKKIVFWVRYANHCYIKPPPSGGKNNGWYTSTVLLVACSSRAKTCRHGGAPRPRKFSEQLEYHFYLSEVFAVYVGHELYNNTSGRNRVYPVPWLPKSDTFLFQCLPLPQDAI